MIITEQQAPDAEAGIEAGLQSEETPDGRPGVSLLFFGFSREALQKAVVNRVGQCVLTCATTACYNGLPLVKDKTIRVGIMSAEDEDVWAVVSKLSRKAASTSTSIKRWRTM